jgi:uncharacterized repeat protein (TIGR01451 family)
MSVVSPPSQDGQSVSVGIGESATYRICVDTNENDFITHNVSVTDVLPQEVEFVSAGSGGVYEPDSRSCTWTFSSLMPGEQICTDLVVRVNDKAVLQQPIVNRVTAKSNETPPVESSPVQLIPCESTLSVLALELIYSDQLCKDCSDKLQAVLTLPPEVKLTDIDPNVMLVLDPGGEGAGSQIVYGRDGRVKIRAFFDTTKLLESVDGYGRVTVTVKGWLQSGRAFMGQRSLLITPSMRHK